MTIFPAFSWRISDSTYCLDLDHGKWLVQSETRVQEGQVLYECSYKDIYFDGFTFFMKSLFDNFVEYRISFPCPLAGTIKRLSHMMYDTGNRDISVPLQLKSKKDISELRPMFHIASPKKEAISPMAFHRPWFDFVDRYHNWMYSAMQRSHFYNPQWRELVKREKQYPSKQMCPVLGLDEFNTIWYR